MTPEMIQLLISFILQIGPLAVDEFLKVEEALNLTADEKTNIANSIASAHASNSDTVAKVSAWMDAQGFKSVTITQFVPKGGFP